MYGTLAFSRDGKSPSAEFRTVQSVQGKCFRQSACDRCRISRVKCSGRLPDSDCERCTRLGKPCSYTASQRTRQTRQSSKSTEGSTRAQAPSPGNEVGAGKSSGLPHLASPDLPRTVDRLGTEDLSDAFDGTWWRLDDHPHISSSWPEAGAADLPSFLAITDDQCFSAFLNPERQDDAAYTLISPPSSVLTGGDAGNDCTAKKTNTTSHAFEGPGDLVIPGTTKSTDGCRCLQQLSSCLFALDSCKGSQLSLVPSQTDAVVDSLEIDDFLDLFKHSMMRLRVVESCRFTCFVSREFAVLLLMSVEQLTKLLLDLAANTSSHRKSAPSRTPECRSSFASPRQDSHESLRHSAQESRDSSIGKFKLRDPLDLQVVIEQLLRIRVRDLQSFIMMISDKMEHYGLDDLNTRFSSIQEELSKIFPSDEII